jgi:hypothetical protein
MSMNEAKRKTFGHVVKGWAILLCLLFFVCPLIKCAESDRVTASGWEIATGTGKLFEDKGGANPFVFALVLIPAAVLVLALLNKPFTVLRNTSIAGLAAKIVFMIAAYVKMNTGDFKGAFVLTVGSWFVLLLYAGLVGFTHWCAGQEKTVPSGDVAGDNASINSQ